ncbi:MAG: DUF2911 domain-containing protein [Verrucomicrobia bacterium]|nr:DUF2911 domain-containing protein [Verrucomicrobiota bacterium]
MQKLASSFLLIVVAVAGASTLAAQQPASAPAKQAAARPAGRVSPHDTISHRIDGRRDALVTIIYGRPYAKNPKTGETRKIWGALVPHGKVWRMGADEATTLITQQALELGGTTVPAGAYTLAMQVEADGSAKLIVCTNLGQWGIPYQTGFELARISMTKEPSDKTVDQFTIALDKNPAGGGVLKAAWENTQYSVPFAIKK